jgi:hypothetical protein
MLYPKLDYRPGRGVIGLKWMQKERGKPAILALGSVGFSLKHVWRFVIWPWQNPPATARRRGRGC